MGLSETLAQIEALNLRQAAPLVPSEMTDEELAKLRFTFVSLEDEEMVMEELKKRGLAL